MFLNLFGVFDNTKKETNVTFKKIPMGVLHEVYSQIIKLERTVFFLSCFIVLIIYITQNDFNQNRRYIEVLIILKYT